MGAEEGEEFFIHAGDPDFSLGVFWEVGDVGGFLPVSDFDVGGEGGFFVGVGFVGDCGVAFSGVLNAEDDGLFEAVVAVAELDDEVLV